MTCFARLLENFGTPAAPQGAPAGPSAEELESLRLDAYEDGYKAGWEDAAKAQSDDRLQLAGDFARNLQDLSFTYHEAHAHVLKAMRPLLEEMVAKVLPDLAHETLLPRVVEELHRLARGAASRSVEIVVHPENVTALQGLIDGDFGFPVAAVEDASLGPDQVFLRLEDEERQIDLGQVLGGISEAVAGFLHDSEKDRKHG